MGCCAMKKPEKGEDKNRFQVRAYGNDPDPAIIMGRSGKVEPERSELAGRQVSGHHEKYSYQI